MKWVKKFFESINHFAGETVRKDVEEACGKLRSGSDGKAEWIRNAMRKLEDSIDKKTMKKIMIATCPHTFPKGRIQKLRRKYKELGTIDKLLEVMRKDSSWKGSSYYDHPIRKGNIIYMTKIPHDPQAHRGAINKQKKQLAYCHCPWIKAAITAHKEVPPTFCYCAASWDKQLWEGILEREIEVELITSLLQGADSCVHAFHLPPDII
ncbi:MAG: hypothetical protein JSV51_01315 [Candidatus Bathyarchaeota archaeon]|nr:MAG: hypothetical protein JSV51_01315 [Candidatus Bathyarchaeota archaeon]